MYSPKIRDDLIAAPPAGSTAQDQHEGAGRYAVGEGLRETQKPLSLGDDCKAAATDVLKKCATLFGVGLHLYLDDTAASPASPPKDAPPPKAGGDGQPERLIARQLSAIYALGKSLGKSNQDIKKYTLEVFNRVPDFLTRGEASTIIQMLQEEKANG